MLLYWDIGRMIVNRQRSAGWGTKVIDRLGRDLRKSFSEMQGFSTQNMQLIRSFAEGIARRRNSETACFPVALGACHSRHAAGEGSEAREWYLREAVRQAGAAAF